MSNITSGADALNALNRPDDSGSGADFTSFKIGTTLTVKVLGTADLVQFFSYGIFKQVDSFVAAKPSKKSPNGYPTEDLTPWDKAWKYHKDLSKEFNDAHGKKASEFRAKERYAMGFFDLDSGEQIIIDLSKNQAQLISGIIMKYENRLNRLAFELSKQGNPAKPTSATVSLTPVLDFEEDLTEEQQKKYEDAPEEFDMKLFEGLLYEATEEEQLQTLTKAGFDVTLIGFEVPKTSEEGETTTEESESEEEEEGKHPF